MSAAQLVSSELQNWFCSANSSRRAALAAASVPGAGPGVPAAPAPALGPLPAPLPGPYTPIYWRKAAPEVMKQLGSILLPTLIPLTSSPLDYLSASLAT